MYMYMMEYHTSCKLFDQKRQVTKFKLILARSGLLLWTIVWGVYVVNLDGEMQDIAGPCG